MRDNNTNKPKVKLTEREKLIFYFNMQVQRPLIPVKPTKDTQPSIIQNVVPPKPPIPNSYRPPVNKT